MIQEHPGQDHGAGRRRLDVGVGEPGVEREDRHLDRKRQTESAKEPELGGSAQIGAQQFGEVESGSVAGEECE
jgi:hypothetical protein